MTTTFTNNLQSTSTYRFNEHDFQAEATSNSATVTELIHRYENNRYMQQLNHGVNHENHVIEQVEERKDQNFYGFDDDGTLQNRSTPGTSRTALTAANDQATTTTKMQRQRRSTEKFCLFEIYYKTPESVCLGDVLHGWMEVTITRPTRVCRMTVTFYGEVEFARGPNGRGSTHSAQFETQSQELWREPTRVEPHGALLQPGFYVYEFFVGTRIDLPPAFISSKPQRHSVRSLLYYCEVRINEFLDDGNIAAHIKRRPIILKTAPNAVPTLLERISHAKPMVERRALFVRNVLDMSGCIVVTLTLANQQCRPNDNLLFSVQVYISLEQHAKIAGVVNPGVQGGGQFENVTHVLYTVRLGEIQANEASKQWLGQTLWLPEHRSLAPVHITQCYRHITRGTQHGRRRLIFLGTHLVVRVKPRFGKTLELRVPLVVRDALVVCGHRFKNGTFVSGAATL